MSVIVTSLMDVEKFATSLVEYSANALVGKYRNFSFYTADNSSRLISLTIEAQVISKLMDSFPEHNIISETYTSNNFSDYTWSFCGLDSKIAFLLGKPNFTTSISFYCKGIPIVSYIIQPITREFYKSRLIVSDRYIQLDIAEIVDILGGNNAWVTLLNGYNLQVRDRGSIDKAICYSDIAINRIEAFPLLAKFDCLIAEDISYRRKISNLADDVLSGRSPSNSKNKRALREVLHYNYCLMASGNFDAIMAEGLSVHNIMPLIPLINGAGGKLLDMESGLEIRGIEALSSDKLLKYTKGKNSPKKEGNNARVLEKLIAFDRIIACGPNLAGAIKNIINDKDI